MLQADRSHRSRPGVPARPPTPTSSSARTTTASRRTQGRRRKSGDPYFVHPASVAGIITELRLDTASVCAGLLHDVVEDTLATDERHRARVRRRDRDPRRRRHQALARSTSPRKEDRQAENFRKMVVAMARDIRVLLVKLCDRARQHADARAHEARGAGAHRARDDGDLRAAREPPRHPGVQERARGSRRSSTSSPTAYTELVDADPEDASASATSTSPRSARRSRARLAEQGFAADVTGRAKHLYSIWRKMKAQQCDFEQVYDIIAFRVLVESVSDCYAALGVIHSQWTPVPGPLQGLHRAAEAEHVPVAPHDGHRPGARAHRDPDPHARDAPRRRARHRRALEVQGAARRRHRPTGRRSASAGCASSWSGRRSSRTRPSSSRA